MTRPPRTRVVDRVNAALRDRSAAGLLGAFVQAGRDCAAAEARGDVRDGLIDMPLPFRAAELLGLDADLLVANAAEQLDGPAAGLLREYAARPDRADVGAMGWALEASDAGWRFTGWGA